MSSTDPQPAAAEGTGAGTEESTTLDPPTVLERFYELCVKLEDLQTRISVFHILVAAAEVGAPQQLAALQIAQDDCVERINLLHHRWEALLYTVCRGIPEHRLCTPPPDVQ